LTAILNQAEALCREIAPRDLAKERLYIVPQSRLPAELCGASVCDGYTGPSLDLHIQDEIGPAWAGRGACMVVNDATLQAETDPRDFEQAMYAVIIHELTHILERPTLYTDRTDVDPNLLIFERLVLADALTRGESADQPIYAGHAWQFVRLAIHACERAFSAGVYVPPSAVCAGCRYGLSHVLRYQDALGDEPDRLAKLTFREIHRTTPPPAFIDLWLSDLNAHNSTSRKEPV